MAKTNYNQQKRQREAARKARQDARLARRQARPTDATPAADDSGVAAAPAQPVSETAS
jgi:hypothetical protein